MGESVFSTFAPSDPERAVFVLCLARLALVGCDLERVDDDEVRVADIGRVEVVPEALSDEMRDRVDARDRADIGRRRAREEGGEVVHRFGIWRVPGHLERTASGESGRTTG